MRGLELVRACEVLVYDALVAAELVDEAPVDALRIPREGLRQRELDTLLVELGRAGYETVRLKGGDPFVFGRGGEEAEALDRAGIPYTVVPGCPRGRRARGAGIPLTHRGVSAQVTLVSGHSAAGEELDYESLARAPGTLVLFMALRRLGPIARGLIGAGKAPGTPAAAIARGTRPDEQAVVGDLATIARLARGLPQPALVVVGDVVALRRQPSRRLASSTSLAGAIPA